MEPNEQETGGKEAYEAKKKERLAHRTHSGGTPPSTGKSPLRFVKAVIVALVLIAIAYGIFLWVRSITPQGEDLSRAIPELSGQHLAGDSSLPQYNSNPPTSGPHHSVPARGGFRTEFIADGNIIHSLEHGFVWISYRPDVSPEVKEQLKDLTGNLIIITERPENDTDIALGAWGRLDTFNVPEGGVLDERRIKDFITRHRNRAPESVTGSHSGI